MTPLTSMTSWVVIIEPRSYKLYSVLTRCDNAVGAGVWHFSSVHVHTPLHYSNHFTGPFHVLLKYLFLWTFCFISGLTLDGTRFSIKHLRLIVLTMLMCLQAVSWTSWIIFFFLGGQIGTEVVCTQSFKA